MATIGNTISSDLASQIQLLSAINDDTNLAASDKEVKLKQEGEKTLAMIEKEKGSLSIVNLAFASNIQDVIQAALASDDWDGIPPPAEIKREIADLQQVSQALAVSLNQGFNDANEVMKLLIDINSKYGQAKAKEWLTIIKSSIDSAKEQFANNKRSIASQHDADKISAIGQIVGGSLSCAMSAGSMIGSAVNAKKQLSALKDQKELHLGKNQIEGLGKNYQDATTKLNYEQTELTKMKANPNANAQTVSAQEIKVQNYKNVEFQAEIDFKTAKNAYTDAKFALKNINIKNQTEAVHLNMLGQMGGATSSIVANATGLRAADLRADASYSKLESDEHEYQKSFEQNFAQITLDQYQKAGQFVDKSIQTMLNVEQSRSGQISAANRA